MLTPAASLFPGHTLEGQNPKLYPNLLSDNLQFNKILILTIFGGTCQFEKCYSVTVALDPDCKLKYLGSFKKFPWYVPIP